MTTSFRRMALASAALTASLAAHAEEGRVECARYEQAAAAIAAGKAPFNEATGERPDHLAPARQIDMEHFHIVGRFANLRDKSAHFDTILVFKAMQESLRVLDLDALDFRKVHVQRLSDKVFPVLQEPLNQPFQVPLAGEPEFYYSGKKLSIRFDPPLKMGERAAIRVSYDVEDTPDGLNWIVPSANDPDQRPEMWSQGESESNRYWIPCADYPNDMATSEEMITVANPNIVIGNGELVDHTDNGDGTSMWHYRMKVPHVTYLISLIVGQFAKGEATAGPVKLEYYLPANRAADVELTYRNTPEMVEFLGQRFGTPYPYPKYAQTVVQNFSAGGMENITATTLNYSAILDANIVKNGTMCGDNNDSLIVHELGHQWFGDLVTCRNWTHLWLNEGWASYCEPLWYEHKCGRDRYDAEIWKRALDIAGSDTQEDPATLVFTQTPSPEAMFGFKGSLVYDKGGYFLHMLRERLGDDAFFAGVKLYLERQRHTPVTTEDFRAALEDASGDDLEGFFRQWCYTPGTPKFRIGLDYDVDTHEAVVSVDQEQKIDAATPAVFGDMKMYFKEADGTVTTATRPFARKSETFRVAMKTAPVVFSPDPNGAVLKTLNIDAPIETIIRTALEGPTAYARLDAIKQLEKNGKPKAIELLETIAADPKRSADERARAMSAFRDLKNPEAVAALKRLATMQEPDYRVRKPLAYALGGHKSDVAAEALIRLCDDPADAVAREALEEVGRMRAPGIFEALEKGYARRGNLDRVRNSAVTGFERLKDVRAAEVMLAGTAHEFTPESRADSIGGIASVIEFEPDAAKEKFAQAFMAALAEDDKTVQRAAASALGKIRYRPAREELDKVALNALDERLANTARAAVTRIDEQPPARTAEGQLQDRILELERKLEKLTKQVSEAKDQDPKLSANGDKTTAAEAKKDTKKKKKKSE